MNLEQNQGRNMAEPCMGPVLICQLFYYLFWSWNFHDIIAF